MWRCILIGTTIYLFIRLVLYHMRSLVFRDMETKEICARGRVALGYIRKVFTANSIEGFIRYADAADIVINILGVSVSGALSKPTLQRSIRSYAGELPQPPADQLATPHSNLDTANHFQVALLPAVLNRFCRIAIPLATILENCTRAHPSSSSS